MPAGLQAWDAAGNLSVDLTDRLSRIVGEVLIRANTSGSVTVDSSLGQPWILPIATTAVSAFTPTFVINGGTISWSPTSSIPSLNDAALLIYGVF